MKIPAARNDWAWGLQFVSRGRDDEANERIVTPDCGPILAGAWESLGGPN